MGVESESIPRNKMPNNTNGALALLWKVNQFLTPFLIAFCVWVVKENWNQDRRIASVEDWRESHNTFAADSLRTIAKERDDADGRNREVILREVERAASVQREAIASQLAAMQRDLIRIAVTLEMQKLREPSAFRPSNGDARKEGETLDLFK